MQGTRQRLNANSDERLVRSDEADRIHVPGQGDGGQGK